MRIWRDVGDAMTEAYREDAAVDQAWWGQTVPYMAERDRVQLGLPSSVDRCHVCHHPRICPFHEAKP